MLPGADQAMWTTQEEQVQTKGREEESVVRREGDWKLCAQKKAAATQLQGSHMNVGPMQPVHPAFLENW